MLSAEWFIRFDRMGAGSAVCVCELIQFSIRAKGSSFKDFELDSRGKGGFDSIQLNSTLHCHAEQDFLSFFFLLWLNIEAEKWLGGEML